MSAEHEFTHDLDAPTPPIAAGDGAAAADAGPAPAPLVVVQYRHRGLPLVYLPILLILAAVVAVVAARRAESYWPREANTPWPAPAPATQAAAIARDADEAAPDVTAPPGEGVAIPEPAIKVVDRPAEPLLPSPPQATPAPIGFDPLPTRTVEVAPPAPPPSNPVVAQLDAAPEVAPPAEAVQPIPPPIEARPEVTKEGVEADIRKESEQMKREARAIEDLKPRLPAIERQRRMENHSRNIAGEYLRLYGERPEFLRQLRAILKAKGDRAGADIEKFCDSDPNEVDSKVEKFLDRYIAWPMAPPEMRTIEGQVRWMRVNPFPEAEILARVARDQVARIGPGRNEPADKNEAWVRAAKILLNIPLPGSPPPPRPVDPRANPSAPPRISFPPRSSSPPPPLPR